MVAVKRALGRPTRENESGEVRGLLPGDGRNESWARMTSGLVRRRSGRLYGVRIPHGAAIAFPTAFDTLRALGFPGAPTPVPNSRHGNSIHAIKYYTAS